MAVERLTLGQILDWGYAWAVSVIEPEKRLALDRELGLAKKRTSDPLIPKKLHSMDMPDWWDDSTPDVNW